MYPRTPAHKIINNGAICRQGYSLDFGNNFLQWTLNTFKSCQNWAQTIIIYQYSTGKPKFLHGVSPRDQNSHFEISHVTLEQLPNTWYNKLKLVFLGLVWTR